MQLSRHLFQNGVFYFYTGFIDLRQEVQFFLLLLYQQFVLFTDKQDNNNDYRNDKQYGYDGSNIYKFIIIHLRLHKSAVVMQVYRHSTLINVTTLCTTLWCAYTILK
ncbi:hypothetical protein D3C87_1933160 [compost metagenome]